jgi:hypothetical protein
MPAFQRREGMPNGPLSRRDIYECLIKEVLYLRASFSGSGTPTV